MDTQWLEILGAVAKAASQGASPQEFSRQALAELLPLLGLDLGAVYVLENHEFRLFAYHGLSPAFARAAERNPRDHPYLGQALSRRRPLVAQEFRDPLTHAEGITLAVYVPLLVADQELGVLAVGARRPWRPTPADLERLENAAGVLALALAFSRKQAELTATLHSFQQLVENELVGILVIQDEKLVFVNSALAHITGYGREELLGRNYLDFVHPEDRAMVQRNYERRRRGEDAPRRYRFRALHKEGYPLTLEVQAWPIVYRGRPAVQGILRDVTWEAEAERLQRSLLAVAQEILAAGSLKEVLRRVAQAVVEHSPFRRAVVSLYDLRHHPPLLGPVLAMATAGLTPEEEEKLRGQGGLRPEQRLLAFREEFRVGRSYYIPHDRVPWGEGLGLPGHRASAGWHPDDVLLIPLRGRAGIVGHISVDEPITPREPTLRMLEPLEVFADLAALAAERAFQMEELQRHKEWLRGAFKLAHELVLFESVPELLSGALEVLRQEVRYEFGAVLLAEGEELVVAATYSDLSGPGYLVGQRLPLGRGITGWVARERRPARVGDVRQDPRYVPVHPDIRAELAVPILFGTELIGVLDVESVELERFRPEDEDFLTAVADLLSMAMASLRAREALRNLSYRDPLTNLYNRRYLFEVLSREVRRAQRYAHPFALVLLDVDNFRHVNNVFGHLRGDEVLKELAKLLVQNLRASDYVFRYGGDEFLLLLPETDEAGAQEAVARVRAKLRAWSRTQELGVVLDFSAGVAVFDPREGRPPEELLREADARMYAEKKARLG
ncbi:MAG: diguanylate cyclase domain-containing protein [Candidatus Bipolaricaulaceae bacterium]